MSKLARAVLLFGGAACLAASPAVGQDATGLRQSLRAFNDREARAAAAALGIDFDAWLPGCLQDAASIRGDFTPAEQQQWLEDEEALGSLCRRVMRDRIGVQPPARRASLRAEIIVTLDMTANPTTLGADGVVVSGPTATPAAARTAAEGQAAALGVAYADWSAGCGAALAARMRRGQAAGYSYQPGTTTCDMLLANVPDGSAATRDRTVDFHLTALERKADVDGAAARARAAADPNSDAAKTQAAQAAATRLKVDYRQWMAGCEVDLAARIAEGRKRYEYGVSADASRRMCHEILATVKRGSAGAREDAVDERMDAVEARFEAAESGG